MSARTRVLAIVGLAAVAAVAAVVGVTWLQTRGETTTPAGAVTAPRSGYPLLELDFGVRADAEARALARAETLYNKGKVAQAAPIFARYDSLAAGIGSAFAAWKQGGGLDALKRLVASHPRSPLAELHLGLAYYWAGRNADAVAAFEKTAKLGPDTPYAVDAENVLHAAMIPGLPTIVTDLELPAADAKLPAAQQLRRLQLAAAHPDERAKLLYGLALWNLRRPLSAERQFAAAAALAPGDPVARTVAAVGLFTKANPVRAFGKLGPLTGVFPHAAVVRFHLGLLLLWAHGPGWRAKATAQLRLAVADSPQSVYAKEAKVLLASLVKNGTK
jgi:tetratricopeptide (TPR) repeat protein